MDLITDVPFPFLGRVVDSEFYCRRLMQAEADELKSAVSFLIIA